MTGAGTLLAHGVGSRQDLHIPLSYAMFGAGIAILVSFLVLGLLWRQPRLGLPSAGALLPARLTRVLDVRGLRVGLRTLGAAAAAYVVMAAVFGRDDALNPVPGWCLCCSGSGSRCCRWSSGRYGDP